MTYAVSSGTLNSSIPYHTIPSNAILCWNDCMYHPTFYTVRWCHHSSLYIKTLL